MFTGKWWHTRRRKFGFRHYLFIFIE